MPLETKYHHRAPATCLRNEHEKQVKRRRQAQVEETETDRKIQTDGAEPLDSNSHVSYSILILRVT